LPGLIVKFPSKVAIMRAFISAAVATTTMLAGAAATAEASPIPVTTLLADFNVITNNNFMMNGPDVQGPVLVGGNFSSGSAQLNTNGIVPLPTPLPPGDVLGEVNVFGNTTLSSGVDVHGSLTFVGGSNLGAGTFTGTGAGSQLSGHNFSPINFGTDIWAQLTGFSTTLAGLPANSPASTFDAATGAFTFHANAQGVANITITGAESPSMAQGC
jgi:choice-of-anchor A domain-containing protein